MYGNPFDFDGYEEDDEEEFMIKKEDKGCLWCEKIYLYGCVSDSRFCSVRCKEMHEYANKNLETRACAKCGVKFRTHKDSAIRLCGKDWCKNG